LEKFFVLSSTSFRIFGRRITPFLPLVDLEKHFRDIIMVSAEEH
jgi:hypothetical protein